MTGALFHGAKAVLYRGERLVVMRRDDIPTIPWPGRIDLPGGAREGDESPEACCAREVVEETGLAIDPARFTWRCFNPDAFGPSGSWLFAAEIGEAEEAKMRLGDEGQALWMIEIGAYLAATDAIPKQQARVRAFWAER
ncbi:MAG: NUDIX hydrolase [Pseudomonadota bacterium]